MDVKTRLTYGPAEGAGQPPPGTEAQVYLWIRVKEGPHYASLGEPSLLRVFDGTGHTAAGSIDRDSGQFAVQWTKQDGTEAARKTNAIDPTQPREKAAEWTSLSEEEGKSEICKGVRIEPSATRVEVVLIYTDVLYRTRAEWATTPELKKTFGDMPGIIGSWTGTRNAAGGWDFTPHRDDVIHHQDNYPTGPEQDAKVVTVTNYLEGKTPYSLRRRAAPESEPKDTGFDIVPKN